MIDLCFVCNKELEWAEDDYVFSWTRTGKTTSGLKPFCNTCSHKATMDYNEAKEILEKQLSLF